MLKIPWSNKKSKFNKNSNKQGEKYSSNNIKQELEQWDRNKTERPKFKEKTKFKLEIEN